MVLWIRNTLFESKGNLFFAKYEKGFVVLKANVLFMFQMLAKSSSV